MYQFCLILFLVLCFAQCKQAGPKTESWDLSEVSNLPEPISNQAVSEGFTDGKTYIYSFGGLDSSKLHSGIHRRSYRLDLNSNRWERLPNIPDTLGKIASAATRIDQIIYIIGGYHVFEDGSERSSDKVHRFDIEKNIFLEDGEAIPIPIDDQVQFSWKDRYIYVVSGWSDSSNVSSVQIYDTQKNKWLRGTSVPNNNLFKSFGASGSVLGDTIYYLGGASMGTHYPIQSILRKGVINRSKPSEISWSSHPLDTMYVGYRMASFNRKNRVYWIGGSNQTYNYNGVAYDGSGGVEPNARILSYNGSKFYRQFNKNIPMDLRGIANIDDSLLYVIGGIEKNQEVTDKVWKLKWVGK